jgi:hypothetical protein
MILLPNLKRTLLLNAGFSLCTSTLCLLLPIQTTQLIGVPDVMWIQGLGLMLMIFALIVTLSAFNNWNKLIPIIILLDWAWVISSAIILVLNPFNFTTSGLITLFIIAVIIGLFAWNQTVQLKKLAL